MVGRYTQEGESMNYRITLIRVDADKPFDRKDVEVEARHMDRAAKKAEKQANVDEQKWMHIRIRELTQ
jgi:hypothetical protein